MTLQSSKQSVRLVLCGLALTLASCSGGAGSLVPKATKNVGMAELAFTMHWPSKRATSSVRRPMFISPQTKSVVVEVNDDASLTTTADKPAQGDISTVSIQAPVGDDTISITTWDQAGGSGNLLGQITVSQTIAAGKLNTVTATVDGVLEKIGISGAPNSFLESSQDSAGVPTFKLVGTVAQTFTILPEDVDGDIIVPPGDAPTLSMTSTDPSITVRPIQGQANQYTVQAASQTPYGTNVALKVSGNDGLGNLIVSQFSIAQSAAIYVGYNRPNGGKPVVIYDQEGNVIASSGAFPDVVNPISMTYDTSRNRIIVADASLGKLAAFDAQGNADPGFVPLAVTSPTGVVYDADLDRLYVASWEVQSNVSSVSAFTGDGQSTPLSADPTAGMSKVWSITYDPNWSGALSGPELFIGDNQPTSGALVQGFFADGTLGTTSQFFFPGDFSITGLAYDSVTDKVFAVGLVGSGFGAPIATLRAMDPNYGTWSQITATDGLSQPNGIAFNPINHELYVTNGGDNTVSVYHDIAPTSTYERDTSANFTPPSGQTNPWGIVVVY